SDMLEFAAVQTRARFAAAGEAAFALHAQSWMEPTPPIPPFGLPFGLGDLTLAPSEEELADALVVPEDTLLLMVTASARPAHAKPRPAAIKTRPTAAPGRATNPP